MNFPAYLQNKNAVKIQDSKIKYYFPVSDEAIADIYYYLFIYYNWLNYILFLLKNFVSTRSSNCK